MEVHLNGLDPNAVGKQITIRDVPVTIAGVAPKDFFGIVAEYRTQVWVSLATAPAIYRLPRVPFVALMGRLKPGVSIEQAQSELALLYRQSIDEATLRRDPNWSRVKFKLEPAGAGLSHAPTWPACCSRAELRGNAKWPCASRSAPDGRNWRARC